MAERANARLTRGIAVVGMAILAAMLFTSKAQAEPPTQILAGHGDIACTTQGVGDYEGQTWCGTNLSSPGNVSSSPGVEGVPVDLNVALPATGEAPYPVVLVNHGNGQQKFNFEYAPTQHWLNKGYAVYSQTARGYGYTCLLNKDDPGCEKGYSHLMDFRYEVRDAQNILGLLADEEIIQPTKIATTGNSYGGGMSMALAVLKNRVMDLDGSLKPWLSPDGKNLEIAVAVPLATWTDFSYAIAPNGNAVDYIQDAGYYGPTGVMKESYVQGLIPAARNAPAGTDPQADILGWTATLNAGEPYDSNPVVAEMREEVGTYHSSYGLPPTQAPAPTLMVQGFTDDVFPVDETTRFYNRTRALFPDVPVGLFFGSLGHPRGQVQANVATAYWDATSQWVDHYLGDVDHHGPPSAVTTYTQTCPNGSPAEGPYTSPEWATIAPGEIRVKGGSAARTISPDGGDFGVAGLFNPLSSLFNPAPAGTACAIANGAKEPGSVNFETKAAPTGGYTVMGASTVIAKVAVNGDGSQIAARLVDVSPDGSEKILVSRGLWRPDGSGFQVFQLFANGWKVEQGHVLRLELLPRDAGQAEPGGPFNNYGRPSNDQKNVKVSYVDLRIPVVETPGALGGLVKSPAPRVLPDRPGVKLAKGNEQIGSVSIARYARLAHVGPLKVGKLTVKGKKMKVKVKCPAKFTSCKKAKVVIRAKGKVRGFKKPLLAKRSGLQAGPGKTRTFNVSLTNKARQIFRDKRFRKRGKLKVRKGAKKVRATITVNGKRAGQKTVVRVGKVR